MSSRLSLAVPTPESLTQDWTGHTVDMAGALLLVLMAVFIASLALKHFQSKANMTGGHLKVIQALSVGTKDRVLLVQVGKEQILMGLSAAGINHLHTLSENVETPSVQPSSSNAGANQGTSAGSSGFADALKSLTQKRSS